MENKISIIIPVYNVESYLDRCIQSILNQTYQNIEIILINDGSTDLSGNICDQYSLIDHRIIAIHKVNGGLSDARNTGIDIATGNFLGFVDSDDFVHPQMFEILYNNLIKENADISVCSFEKVYSDRININIEDNKTLKHTNIEVLNKLFTFQGTNFIVAWNKLYKKSLFNEIRYPKGKIREDEYTTYKLLYRSNIIVETTKTMYYYFQTNNSIMHTQSLEKELHYADAIEERINFYNRMRLHELHLRLHKRYCLWLISTIFHLRKNKHIKDNLNKRKQIYLSNLLKESNETLISKLAFLLAQKAPVILGFFAYHKIHRDNMISKVSSLLFNDHHKPR